jgi:hypothetical protein
LDFGLKDVAGEKWQKEREIFDSALRRQPQERRRFVNEASGNDKTLLAKVKAGKAKNNPTAKSAKKKFRCKSCVWRLKCFIVNSPFDYGR